MGKLQPARGTRDLYGEDLRRMRRVIERFLAIGATYGFEDFQTPIFEFAEVYSRPLGEASDIVSKEMYGFTDRGGEALTLRPEFTAGVSRAFISNGLQQSMPCRFISHGPLFRYERPQKGRYRQFHQINAELLGQADAVADVEIIALAARLLRDLGVDSDVVLHLNSLGDAESRAAYRAALTSYYRDHRDRLSEDSQLRLDKNPLRILDSKDDGDKAINQNAPFIADSLSDAARRFWDDLTGGLAAAGVAFTHDQRLVRGLDYYTHTAFEFITTALGAQGTVIGGGRYDGLIKQLGGPPTPGVGFAGGIERLAMLLAEDPGVRAPVFVMPMGDSAQMPAVQLCEQLRAAGLVTVNERSGNLGKRLKRADSAGVRYAVILGEDEVAAATVTLKDLSEGEQKTVAQDTLAALLLEAGA